MCNYVGVKICREEVLWFYVVGIFFGQWEKFINCLKCIFNGYFCGKELLKELLQNVDDVMVIEVCFVKDFCIYLKKYIFDFCWELLQGLVLCVYNNKFFKKVDIEGI